MCSVSGRGQALCALEGGGERATGQDADEVAAKFGGSALIRDRSGGGDGQVGGFFDQSRRDRLALEASFGVPVTEVTHS